MCAKRSDIQIPVQIWTQFRAKESEYERRCILIYGQMLNRLPLYLDRSPLYRGPVSVKVAKPNCCTSFLCCCWQKLCRTTRTVSHSLWQFLSRIQSWLYSCLVSSITDAEISSLKKVTIDSRWNGSTSTQINTWRTIYNLERHTKYVFYDYKCSFGGWGDNFVKVLSSSSQISDSYKARSGPQGPPPPWC